MSRLIVNTIRPVSGTVTDVMDLGQGQLWYNMLPERQSGVEYVNTTGRPIMVNVTETGNNSATFEIDGLVVAQNAGNNSDSTISIIVSPNAVYKFTAPAGIIYWAELR